jgi:hypothetical protein
MIYRVKNKTRGPVQLAIHTRDNNGTELMVLPAGKAFDIPEERYSVQIGNLEKSGMVTVEKVFKKEA